VWFDNFAKESSFPTNDKHYMSTPLPLMGEEVDSSLYICKFINDYLYNRKTGCKKRTVIIPESKITAGHVMKFNIN
jgi:hypothetical protein